MSTDRYQLVQERLRWIAGVKSPRKLRLQPVDGHEADQLALVAGVKEDGPHADTGQLGDLARAGGVVTFLGEKLASRVLDAPELLCLVIFPQAHPGPSKAPVCGEQTADLSSSER